MKKLLQRTETKRFCVALVFLLFAGCINYFIHAEGTGAAVVAELDVSDTQAVNSMYVWLWDNESNKMAGWSEYSGDDAAIEDALTYTDADGMWYLIPVSYLEDTFAKYGYVFDEDECPFTYAPDATAVSSDITAAYYVAVMDGSTTTYYLRVQDTTGYTIARSNITYTTDLSDPIVTDAVMPTGTVINLFDYWTTGQDDADVGVNSAEGINDGHALIFSYNGRQNVATKVFGALDEYNLYTKGNYPYTGIVESLLVDGYPYISSAIPAVRDSATSYIYDGTDYAAESLAYLFDPDVAVDGKASYSNVTGLLQKDEDGYYYYNSRLNYAEYNSETNAFILYEEAAIGNGEFFPFDSYTEATSVSSHDAKSLNHYFGVSMTTNFIQQYGGYTDDTLSEETTFEFSGDDDVWIYIDGVLAADLGGIHDSASVSINFVTGEITVNGTVTGMLYDAYEAAGVTWYTSWDGDTYADGTYHVLSFFYLERGNSASNLQIRFNQMGVESVPEPPFEFSFTKIDGSFTGSASDADTLSDVSFSLYYAYEEDGTYVMGNGEYVQGGYITTVSSGSDGTVKFDDLYSGIFLLYEDSAVPQKPAARRTRTVSGSPDAES